MEKILEKAEEFEKIIKEGTWIVDFNATWCGPCKMLSPILSDVAKEDVNVLKVDTDEFDEIAMKFGIMSIPTLIVFKDGKEVNKSVGLISKEQIMDLVK